MFSKLKCLVVIQLLLSDQAFCKAPPRALGGNNREVEEKVSEPHCEVFKRLESAAPHDDKDLQRVQSAKHFISVLRGKLQRQIEEGLHFDGQCEELLAASRMDDSLSSVFPRELLGLSLVPALVMGGCTDEAQTLMLNLYALLGVDDTEELLLDLEDLIQKRTTFRPTRASSSQEDENNIEAVMVHIKLLAEVRPGAPKVEEHCERWARLNGSTLSGTAVEQTMGDLYHALTSCGKLRVLCAGVTSSGSPGRYHAVFKKGSHIQPSASSECWIHQCSTDQDAPVPPGLRLKRSICINRKEERVYRVMDWIPGVSTFYNLGTAVYYASVNCMETAKERAILSAVDLGTDALVVATGGTAGVAGYALGAGVKTGVKAGVKYLINTMKHRDDVLVNQFSPEGDFTVP